MRDSIKMENKSDLGFRFPNGSGRERKKGKTTKEGGCDGTGCIYSSGGEIRRGGRRAVKKKGERHYSGSGKEIPWTKEKGSSIADGSPILGPS